MGIAAVGFGFDVVPPHGFLAFAERPGGFAGHRATLATNAPVQVEDKSELPVGIRRFIRVFHVAAELPVQDIAHKA
jgi:hypothetical protein